MMKIIKLFVYLVLFLNLFGSIYICVRYDLFNSLHWKISRLASDKYFKERQIIPQVFQTSMYLSEAEKILFDIGFKCSTKTLKEHHCLKKSFNPICNSFLKINLISNNEGLLTGAFVSNIERGCL